MESLDPFDLLIISGDIGGVIAMHHANMSGLKALLLAATGSHNLPYFSPVERVKLILQEYHSSALRDPKALKGKVGFVVGGGASAYDLLELCLEHEAQNLSHALYLDLRGRYEKFRLNGILPERDFDSTRDQIIPGRHRMIENFKQLTRYRSEVRCISGCTLELSTGLRLEADLVLWGTGFTLDLSYFEIPELSGLTQSGDLAKR